MALPSTIDFNAGDLDYIAKLDQLVADINTLYTEFVATTAGELFKATSTTSKTGLSDQELQEMIQIRNEIREMNRLMHVSGANAGSPPPQH